MFQKNFFHDNCQCRYFPGLKPEGVTAAPDGHTLTLVFDRDLRDPLWTTFPAATHAALTREGP